MPSNSELILGGLGQAGQALGKYAEEQAPLSGPQQMLSDFQRQALAHVVAGRMHPREAAIRVKLAHAGHDVSLDPGQEQQDGPGVQAPQQQGLGLAAPQMPSVSYDRKESPQEMQGSQDQLAQQWMQKYPGPANQGEFNQLMQGSQHLGLGHGGPGGAGGLSFDNRLALQNNKYGQEQSLAETKGNVQVKTTKARVEARQPLEDMKEKGRNQRAEAALKMQEKLKGMGIQAAKEVAADQIQARRDLGDQATEKDVYAHQLSSYTTQINAIRGANAKLLSAINPNSPAVQTQVKANNARLKVLLEKHSALTGMANDEGDPGADETPAVAPTPDDSTEE